MTHQYKKLPVTMKIWMQFNFMTWTSLGWMQFNVMPRTHKIKKMLMIFTSKHTVHI